MKTTIGGFVMPGIKGMKKYPQEIKEKIVKEIYDGATQRELSRKYNISRYAIKCWIGVRPKVSAIPKQRGRKPAKTLQENKYENKRLKMENELLRDFLSLTERK